MDIIDNGNLKQVHVIKWKYNMRGSNWRQSPTNASDHDFHSNRYERCNLNYLSKLRTMTYTAVNIQDAMEADVSKLWKYTHSYTHSYTEQVSV